MIEPVEPGVSVALSEAEVRHLSKGLKHLLLPELTVVAEIDRIFYDRIYPVLTPLAVDPGHPFPFISNLSLSLAVGMKHPDREAMYFARIKVPTSQSRWLRVTPSEHEHHYVPVEQVL